VRKKIEAIMRPKAQKKINTREKGALRLRMSCETAASPVPLPLF
jgi:hypothetical protein